MSSKTLSNPKLSNTIAKTLRSLQSLCFNSLEPGGGRLDAHKAHIANSNHNAFQLQTNYKIQTCKRLIANRPATLPISLLTNENSDLS